MLVVLYRVIFKFKPKRLVASRCEARFARRLASCGKGAPTQLSIAGFRVKGAGNRTVLKVGMIYFTRAPVVHGYF